MMFSSNIIIIHIYQRIVGGKADKNDNNVSLSKEDNFGGSVMRKKGEPQLTLADLLEVLDGVMEMEGRMLVITTTMTRGSLLAMFRHYLVMDLPSGVCAEKLPDRLWTPAEVT